KTPVPTRTTRPTATKTPVPTKTTRPTATKTPVPTRTTRPTATKTPVPTRTTRPTATKTPVPTKTTRPTATKTPVPTRTTRPTATKTPVIVKTLPTAAEPILFGSKSLAVGDLVLFGRYEQDNDFRNLTEPIEWWVLAVEDGKALLLSRYALDVVPFNDSYDGVSWDTSSIRIWLRQVFFWKAFSRDEKDSILTVVNTTEPNPQDNNSVGGPDTEDKIFLLSYQEVQKYLGTDKSRECEPTDYTVARGGQFDENGGVRKTVWWLRTPGSGLIRVKQSEKYANERMSCIGSDGSFMSSGVVVTDKETAVRPAIWVSTGEN
ncbi:MAG: hypothetical protein IKP86_09495, partial [Anaerolineaceae bacterium]|nr:hypothetical protein [Anaerolineaceae bacterium]